MSDPADDLKEAIRSFLCEDAALDPGEFDDDTLLFSGGYIDSITVTNLVLWLEERLNTKIAPSAITTDNFDSISRLLRFAQQIGA